MKVMVIVKATSSSEAGAMPSRELLEAMGHYNEELVKAGAVGHQGLKARPREVSRAPLTRNGSGPLGTGRETLAGAGFPGALHGLACRCSELPRPKPAPEEG